MKKWIANLGGAALLAGSVTAGYFAAKGMRAAQKEAQWKLDFDTSFPSLREADGWYQTLLEEFKATKAFPQGDRMLNPAIWAPSPHGARGGHYWCDQMVEVKNGMAVIHTRREENHRCTVCKDKNGAPATSGLFTGGIETRRMVAGPDGAEESRQLFSQAFGYFEANVKVPDAPGLWSAFWIQGNRMGQVGNAGRDGSEIDIYESSFIKHPTKTGNCIHYDGYGKYHKYSDHVADTGKNLYDGQFHVYGLKWTPWEYVFYVDGEAVWATDYGGITNVPEFLRLTVELRQKVPGPYGQRMGKFENREDGTTDFLIDYVKVYQNKRYEPFIRSDADYTAKANG